MARRILHTPWWAVDSQVHKAVVLVHASVVRSTFCLPMRALLLQEGVSGFLGGRLPFDPSLEACPCHSSIKLKHLLEGGTAFSCSPPPPWVSGSALSDTDSLLWKTESCHLPSIMEEQKSQNEPK